MFYLIRIHTEKQHITFISDSDSDVLNDEQLTQVKNEIISILTYGELLCDLYFQLKLSQKPLHGRYILTKCIMIQFHVFVLNEI